MKITKALEITRGDVAAAAEFIKIVASVKRRAEEELPGAPGSKSQRGSLLDLASRKVSDHLGTKDARTIIAQFKKYSNRPITGDIYEARVLYAAFDVLHIPLEDVKSYMNSEPGDLKELFEWGMSVLAFVHERNIRFEGNFGIVKRNMENLNEEPTLAAIVPLVFGGITYEMLIDTLELPKFYDLFLEYADVPLNSSSMATNIYRFFIYDNLIKSQRLDTLIADDIHGIELQEPDNPYSREQWLDRPLVEILDKVLNKFDRKKASFLVYNYVGPKNSQRKYYWYPDLQKSVIDYMIEKEQKVDMQDADVRLIVEPFTRTRNVDDIFRMPADEWDLLPDITKKQIWLISFGYDTKGFSPFDIAFGDFDFEKLSPIVQWILKSASQRELMRGLADDSSLSNLNDDDISKLFKALENRISLNNRERWWFQVRETVEELKAPSYASFEDVLSKFYKP